MTGWQWGKRMRSGAKPLSVRAAGMNLYAYGKGDAHSPKQMVQTKKGAQNNSWLEHLRRCAAEYHKSREAEHTSSAAADMPTKVKSPARRVTGKKPDSTKAGALAKGASKPKPKGKPLEEKDTKALNTKVKAEGKKKAKKAEKEASQQKKS